MSKLRVFLNLVKAWPICLASAATAYFTITCLSLFLTPDIAILIVKGLLTVKLVIAWVGALLILNMLLVLTYAASLLIVRRENLIGGLRRNGRTLVKGFILLSITSLACLALMLPVGYRAVFPTSLTQDALEFIMISYARGVVASTLFSLSLVWLVASLAGGRLWIGLGRFLSLIALSFLMLAIARALETGELNKMLLGGRIGETSIVVGDDGVKAFYGGSYLPAVVTASTLGLQLGLLAKPSGETLTITQADLAQRDIVDPGLLSIVYPNGETSTVIYTGKDLQAPLLSYSSGAFVGIQAVETRVVWTSVDKRAFYEQITSVSGLLGNILGSDFKEELLKSILLSDLTDSQALDVVNTLAGNVEWLKTLSRGRRTELVRKITEYVKKGETAEEAIERAKKESEEFAKSVEDEITAFCSSISVYNAQLANEVSDLLNHVKGTPDLRSDAAKWLLDVLRDAYFKALTSTGSREVAEAELSRAVEEVFRYPESKEMGCALASAIVKELMEAQQNLEFKEKPRRVTLKRGMSAPLNMGEGNEAKLGTYVVRVYWEHDGRSGVMEFSIVKGVESAMIKIPKEQVDHALDQMRMDEAQVLITKAELFDYRLFFPTGFTIGGVKIRLDLFNNEMEIYEEHYQFKPSMDIWGEKIRVDAKLEGKNINGKNLVLSFYQDGAVRIRYGALPCHIERIEVDAQSDLMKIKYFVDNEAYTAEYSFNHKPLSEQVGEIPCEMNVEGQQIAQLKERLFRLLGYDALEELEERITADEDRRIILLVRFDNGKVAYCGNEKLRVMVPSGVKSITSIEIATYKELMGLKQLAADVLVDPESTRLKGRLGEAITNKLFMDSILTEISRRSGILRDKLEVKQLGERGEPDFEVNITGTKKRITVIEVKYVSDVEDFKEFEDQLSKAREQVQERLTNLKWTADYGVVVVIAWPPEWILADKPPPDKVGEFNNPYIEYFSKEGG